MGTGSENTDRTKSAMDVLLQWKIPALTFSSLSNSSWKMWDKRKSIMDVGYLFRDKHSTLLERVPELRSASSSLCSR